MEQTIVGKEQNRKNFGGWTDGKTLLRSERKQNRQPELCAGRRNRGRSLTCGDAACWSQRRGSSGKTAVLVERIISLVTDSSHPVDVDQLLVVTFTNAAAAEMRERVLKRH